MLTCPDCRDFKTPGCPWGAVSGEGVCGLPSWGRGKRTFLQEAGVLLKGQPEGAMAFFSQRSDWDFAGGCA